MQINLKNTKLQDENNKPIVFYHATPFPKKINSFLPLSHFGTKIAANMRAMHFAYKSCSIPEPTVLPNELPLSVKKKIKQNKSIPQITFYDVHLAVKRPLKIRDLGAHTLEQYHNWFLDQYEPKSQFLTGAERCEGEVVGPAKTKYKKALTDFIFLDPFTRSDDEIKKELAADSLYLFENKNEKVKSMPSFLFPVRSRLNEAVYSSAEKLAFQRMIRFLQGEGYDAFSYINEHEDRGQNSYIIFRPQQVFPTCENVQEHIVPAADTAFLQKVENDFFAPKGFLSPIQRICKNQFIKKKRSSLKKQVL